MLIWIRALLSTAAEIKTLEGREMLVGLSPPVADWLLNNTSSLVRLDGITTVGQEYDLLGSVQFWSAWFEFTIGCFLAPSLGILSLNYTTLVFVSLISCICQFLAHLSRRLTRWAYRMGLEPASVRPSMRVCVRAWVHTFKHEYLWDR